MLDWNVDEVSTRNCFKCKVKGQMVHCPHGINAFYKSVVKVPKLMNTCKDCNQFEDFKETKIYVEMYHGILREVK